ncbi:ABC transporter ATP-binding protein [Streptococcus iniae]|uniref:ABC transporter ATP-binding protein n=1 Tax=Streptococcus iniae TaxID=1346 RepID=A0A3L8GF46_STRIN|nr:ABC transporter ATP-binding protein [Streptococcus iniae]AGM99701.1 ABC transporter ATP-binding protein [Streptococcus iniae SF1]AHY16612.1 ABC transporter ATP-binding protein [Streptococcus iniae]AHY18478.1 ABC transporter ATP-binding protein [Streptococcus iniae]APD32638.1 ABC transporter ATP-binding protein [Streptococcus iniae]ASL35603.1 ABC transporter ATP-binding protein [Streptococcus iniae]
MTYLIEAQQLNKTYGKHQVIQDLNLQIKQGSLVAYLGTNGAGKSTTIKMLTGIVKASSGRVVTKDNLKIGMVFQESILDGELKVKDNLKNRLKMYTSKDDAWLDKIIVMTALRPILHQKYKTLSGGQKRRVDIARALIHKPDILFLDEPTTGLDIQSRQMIWKLFKTLQEEEKLTIFLTSHYLEEADNADMVYIIDKGKILASGSSQDLITQYSKSKLRLSLCRDEDKVLLKRDFQEEGQMLIFEGLDVKEIIAFLGEHSQKIAHFTYQQGTLNDAFLTITGKEID